MKVSYDSEIDALYVRFIEGDMECRTIQLSQQVALDLGPQEQLVGIEILDAKQQVGKGQLPKLLVENLPFVTAS